MRIAMSTEDKSGPAFPGWTQNHYTDQRPTGGMTLRDYFAAKASEEDVRRQGEVMRSAQIACAGIGILEDGWQIKARYMHADAMLRARVV
jgi:hypothetical protein